MKKNICFLTVAAVVAALFADTPVPSGEKIDLADEATVIEETGIVPEKEAVPDFSLILPLQPTALPVLAESNISADTLIQSEAPVSADASGQDVFLEGAIGAGWPGFFSGDFSVYRNIGAEPFKLEFFHESVTGIGMHTAPDGYESQETRLSGEKQLALGDRLLLDVAAGYETRTDGLQGKNARFYDISRQNISGNAVLNWKPLDFLTLKGTADAFFNTQFMSSSSSSNTRSFLGLSSSADLAFDTSVWGADLLLKYDAGTAQNRFEAGVAFSADIREYAQIALSVSSVLAKQASSVLVPFTVAVKTGPSVSFTGSIAGGLKTAAVNPTVLQEETPFLFSGTTPAETTEWFCEAEANIPFYGICVLNVSADFAMTAFDGRRMLPDYTSLDPDTGLMAVMSKDTIILDSTFGMTIPLKYLNATLGWNANWLDSTRYDRTRDSTSAVTAGVYYADEKGTWSAGADVFWAWNRTPEIGLNGCYQVTKAVRLELEAVDLVSLFSGKDRLICNTYAGRGGYAALFVKVNF